VSSNLPDRPTGIWAQSKPFGVRRRVKESVVLERVILSIEMREVMALIEHPSSSWFSQGSYPSHPIPYIHITFSVFSLLLWPEDGGSTFL
jgi:hypothetical protein